MLDKHWSSSETHREPSPSPSQEGNFYKRRGWAIARFKNDTERLEKLFDLYTKMTA